MPKVIKPALWLLILIAALPQFSETVYTPSLPSVASFFNISESLAEYTLSIYLFGMGVGTLFWGRISDAKGRRPCLLMGTCIFIVGCFGCFLSKSIESLLFWRFVQAFGGSTGSVLGQSIARDAFEGKERGKVFSLVGGAISFSPAIGPVLGGLIDEFFGWNYIFTFLGLCGFFAWFFSWKDLKETHHPNLKKNKAGLLDVLKSMITDKKIIACTSLVGGANGIAFSYYSEGPFYLMRNLGLSPKLYGSTFILMAVSGFSGALYSKYLHSTQSTKEIIKRGLSFCLGGTSFFSAMILFLTTFYGYNSAQLIPVTLISMMITIFGIAMTTPNVLSIALEDYEHATGTASSFLGFFYYTFTASVTYIMGLLHNGTLYPMPLFFLLMSIFLFVIYGTVLRISSK